MGFLNDFFSIFSNDFSSIDSTDSCSISDSDSIFENTVNPSTGLPMSGGGVDISGSPYGMDINSDDNFSDSISSLDDDTFSSNDLFDT